MGRPRKISDDRLLAACGRVIGQHGPGFTLAQVAAEAGVAVGTVSTRFGSKHALLATLTKNTTEALRQTMLTVAAEHTDPVQAVRAAALATIGADLDPAVAVHHLALFGVDLADPELRAGLAAHREVIRGVLGALLADAHLPHAPPAPDAAAVLAALVHGVQLDWALSPSGALLDRVRADIDSILLAWRRSTSTSQENA